MTQHNDLLIFYAISIWSLPIRLPFFVRKFASPFLGRQHDEYDHQQGIADTGGCARRSLRFFRFWFAVFADVNQFSEGIFPYLVCKTVIEQLTFIISHTSLYSFEKFGGIDLFCRFIQQGSPADDPLGIGRLCLVENAAAYVCIEIIMNRIPGNSFSQYGKSFRTFLGFSP